jgi:hypothetical protein
LPITSSRTSHLVDSLERAYRVLGLEDAAGGDEVFRHLVLARIIEPSSKLDSLRVLDEAGVTPASYRTQTAPAGLCGTAVAAAAVAGMRRARPPRPGQPGSV